MEPFDDGNGESQDREQKPEQRGVDELVESLLAERLTGIAQRRVLDRIAFSEACSHRRGRKLWRQDGFPDFPRKTLLFSDTSLIYYDLPQGRYGDGKGRKAASMLLWD